VRPRCIICGCFHPPPCRLYARLREALGELQPTIEQDQILKWLAGLDEPTVEPIATLFERLRKETI
jgi:hypothetical protein